MEEVDAIEEEREAKKAKSLAADKDEYDDAEDQEEQGNQMEESSDDSSLIGFEVCIWDEDALNELCSCGATPETTVGAVINTIQDTRPDTPCTHLGVKGVTGVLDPAKTLFEYTILREGFLDPKSPFFGSIVLSGQSVNVYIVNDNGPRDYLDAPKYWRCYAIGLSGSGYHEPTKMKDGVNVASLGFVNHNKDALVVTVPDAISEMRVILQKWPGLANEFTVVRDGAPAYCEFVGSQTLKGSKKVNPWGLSGVFLYRYVALNQEGIAVGCSNVFCLYRCETAVVKVNTQTLNQHVDLWESFLSGKVHSFSEFWNAPRRGLTEKWQEQMWIIKKHSKYQMWGQVAETHNWWIKAGKNGVHAGLVGDFTSGNVRAMPFWYQKLETIMWYLVISDLRACKTIKEANFPKWKDKEVNQTAIVSTWDFLQIEALPRIEICPPTVTTVGTTSK